MNNLITFNFNQNVVRTQQIDGQPYFCLADVCNALEIHNAHTSVKLDEKGIGKTYTLTNGGKQEVVYINEPNLYRLIFRSNKPQAQAFADWVYNEVLPSIRKNGFYSATDIQPVISFDKSPEMMKVVGGMVKRCCASAIKDTMMNNDEITLNAMATIINYIVEKRAEQVVASYKERIANDLKQYLA